MPALAAWVVVLLFLGSGMLVLAEAPRGAAAPIATVAPAHPAAIPAVTHGDLLVGAGTTFVIAPVAGTQTYYQQGNITVSAGGILIVRNTTLSFVQVVGDNGTLLQRIAGLYHFTDAGTVYFSNSTLTTDVAVLNAYPKLNLTLTGAMTLWNSTMAFPGWVTVSGSGGDLTLNNSAITKNPNVSDVTQDEVAILGDTIYAPTLSVSAKSHVNLFHSAYNNTYSDPIGTSFLGIFGPPYTYNPGPLPIFAQNVDLGAFTQPFTGFPAGPLGAAQIVQAYLYPSGYGGGVVWAVYAANGNVTATATVTLTVLGNPFVLGTMSFLAQTPVGVANVSLTAPALAAINAAGLTALLAPGATSIGFSAIAGPPVLLNAFGLSLDPTSISYNITVSGTGTALATVDSSLDLNWQPTDLNTPVPPWDSNKLLILSGATGYLANLTISNAFPEPFSSSAIFTDATSTAYLYRWAQLNLTGQGGRIPIGNATVTPFYAYPNTQASNATANTANNLKVLLPATWAYLQYWDLKNSRPGYGVSGPNGAVSVLLASTEVTYYTLPGGIFLGDYHLGVHIPSTSNNNVWFNWAVSPYPTGVAFGTVGYGLPDYAPTTHFPNYFGAVTVAGTTVLANGTAPASGSVREGQLLGLEVQLTDAGTAPVTAVSAALFYNYTHGTPGRLLDTFTSPVLDLMTPGQTYNFTVSWVVNDTVTGVNGTFAHPFALLVVWNHDTSSLGGGVVFHNASVTIAPSQIRFVSFVTPINPIQLNNQYFSAGVLQFNGSQAAAIALIATPVGGGVPVTIAAGSSITGPFDLTWFPLQQLLSPGTTYKLQATATYNGVTAYENFTGTFSVPASTTSTGFLFEKFLGLPLWLWLTIAAAAIIAIAVVLLLFRRQAAGKLVECGECGELIPEDATVCPKCGAEFESDLVRCSRCSSTIPANSQFCPECSAQLLGKPGEGASDPERQAYMDFTEKYRAEGKKELGENFTESSFWDWWKRQPTYVPFSQWKVQQTQGAPRANMSQPPTGTEMAPAETSTAAGGAPPKGGAGAAPTAAAAAPGAPAGFTAPPLATVSTPTTSGSLKPCPNCGKEIPPEYLVCPFCGAVTQ